MRACASPDWQASPDRAALYSKDWGFRSSYTMARAWFSAGDLHSAALWQGPVRSPLRGRGHRTGAPAEIRYRVDIAPFMAGLMTQARPHPRGKSIM